MNCAVHTNAEATGFCRNCGKAMCPECARNVSGQLYCEPCLAAKVGAGPMLPATPTGPSNPGLALLLGFIPGLGAVYNGQYAKGAIHVLIFGGLIAALSSELAGRNRCVSGSGARGIRFLYAVRGLSHGESAKHGHAGSCGIDGNQRDASRSARSY